MSRQRCIVDDLGHRIDQQSVSRNRQISCGW
jgi:hypothetical protein